MIADLHCHYPMHVVMHEPRHRIEHLLRMHGRLRGDEIRVLVVRAASALFNDEHMWSTERVSVEHLQQGGARLVFSVLHSPFHEWFHEWDLSRRYGAPPEDAYFATVRLQIDEVESDLDKSDDSVVTLVRDADTLERALASGAIAFVHCLEGGVSLGSSTEQIERNIAELKRHGVAYITPAHLFYRQVATNAPAIPFLHDAVGIRRKEGRFDESFEVTCRHIDKLHEITGSHEYVALGTDFDGFIKPTMGGLETPADLRLLEARLAERYGDDAALITSGNALRVLRELWRP
ncbi:MAG TPA: membrane dipeptidase [Thermoleophilaceae bacterium]|nr:membrane dipeptidase [Thermoleophilaceae bacterium]